METSSQQRVSISKSAQIFTICIRIKAQDIAQYFVNTLLLELLTRKQSSNRM